MYVVKRRSDGAYVSKPGSSSSYTRDLRQARKWEKMSDAMLESCVESEYVADLETELEPYRR